jgi:hypothetical protein
MSAPFEKASGQYTDTFAFEALTVAGSATALTAGTYDPVGVESNTPAISATIQCQVAQVRYRSDGTDPTASVGTILEVGEEVVVWGSRDIKSFRAIRTGGTSATLATSYAR